ncbi:MAG: ATP-binding cassette domain-containing protein [Polyangiaceae bacterium]|nr:ATP-binding cassette domain-containing protein [Polyangiaceae bacterium]
MTEPLVRFQGVRKAFGPKVVYRGLDLEIRRGEVLTIVGGSGVGKSVMLKMLIGLLTVDAGSIVFDGKQVTTMKESELALVRRRIAMLFQAGALFDSMTVGENVGYALDEHFRYVMGKKEIAERVHWALSLVGLPGVEAMAPGDLSGGMRKRVALARAIAVHPEVLLYDEPTTGLDPINTARVNHLITGLQEKLNITSVVVTHDMKSAQSISDRIAMVHSGQVICQGTVQEFWASTDRRVSDFIEGRAPREESVEALLTS